MISSTRGFLPTITTRRLHLCFHADFISCLLTLARSSLVVTSVASRRNAAQSSSHPSRLSCTVHETCLRDKPSETPPPLRQVLSPLCVILRGTHSLLRSFYLSYSFSPPAALLHSDSFVSGNLTPFNQLRLGCVQAGDGVRNHRNELLCPYT